VKPTTIRYLGLFHIRKPTYLVLQSIALGLCGVFLIAGLILKVWSPFIDARLTPDSGLGLWDYILLAGVLGSVAEILDLIFTLRAFHRKEEEESRQFESQQARAPRLTDTNIKEG
jgi:hypothetical protein